MLNTLALIAVQTTTIISVIVVVSVKIEHRLTKIETDINWLKRSVNENSCSNESAGEK